jgi:AcrR family transcriptional regulator/DNA-binding MarR family transcriptional regulator
VRVSVRERRPALTKRISSRGGLPREEVSEIQRSRLLVGALGAVDEQGYAAVMVGDITRRAKVSRRTFYELFENREACLAALVADILGMVESELAQVSLEGLRWRERVRGGLWVILSFFDREPALARMVVVQALRGGPQVQVLREQAFARLAQIIDTGRAEGSRVADCTPLTAEGLVGAAFGIVYLRLAREQQEPLTGLLGELMGMIALPYRGPAAARAERTRAVPRSAGRGSPSSRSALALADGDPLQMLPMRVTYRTARVLECVEREPGASNRDVADSAGIKDQGQISKLLARLERLGLLQNTGQGAHTKGESNAWQLTPLGRQVAGQLRISPGHRSEAA